MSKDGWARARYALDPHDVDWREYQQQWEDEQEHLNLTPWQQRLTALFGKLDRARHWLLSRCPNCGKIERVCGRGKDCDCLPF